MKMMIVHLIPRFGVDGQEEGWHERVAELHSVHLDKTGRVPAEGGDGPALVMVGVKIHVQSVAVKEAMLPIK